LSLQVRYAICGVFDLAYNGQGEPVQVRVIGERQSIPPRYLEQIFQRLRRARIVTGKRGPGGGYLLARAPSEITLLDVVEAVEGAAARGPTASDDGPADDAGYRPSFLWPELAGRFRAVLAEISFETLCREAARAHVRRAEIEPSYVI
jgi:Rrf2 family protein